jgi:hypothetical protein
MHCVTHCVRLEPHHKMLYPMIAWLYASEMRSCRCCKRCLHTLLNSANTHAGWQFLSPRDIVDCHVERRDQRRVWRYQRGNQNPYIEEEKTTEKVLKDKQRSTKHRYQTKDQATRTPLKPEVNSGASQAIHDVTWLVFVKTFWTRITPVFFFGRHYHRISQQLHIYRMNSVNVFTTLI